MRSREAFWGKGDPMDVVAPRTHRALQYARRLIVMLCALILCLVMLPLVELVNVFPVMIAALALGARASCALHGQVTSRFARAGLVVVLPTALLVTANVLLATALQGARTLPALWEWLSQILGGWVSLPYWVAVGTAGVLVATHAEDDAPLRVSWLAVQVFIVTAALVFGGLLVRQL